MNAAVKSAWRARLRAQRREVQLPDSGANLARVGLEWLGTVGTAGEPGAMSDGGTPGPLPGPGSDGAGPGSDGADGAPGGHGGQRVVCAYLSMGTEPPTGPLLAALTTAGFAVYVAVCEPDFQLAWTLWSPGVKMARSPFAPVMEPIGPRLSYDQLHSVQAILVPALAVDASGVRLGQGGGYYDRFLAGAGFQAGSGFPLGGDLPAVPLAAVVHENEIFPADSLPHDALDAPVGFALTPAGHHRLAQR